ncbi:nucleotidyl transferase AbiEii/AbiGii toxin family protein [Streptomyces atratus]|uniref:Nucleotidyl transferase AbiEii toxin, Type IV TA system n=1 Tax=Streptomyces atratus TaxID=1893 RepID=A0A2Z5JP75_STRAR|nr:nucleotidyl transferase AbiEii/AbiGii toxin family protein [Streptomyces atratus]AXE82210.1 hypothetical protein C5746_41105 [Streptomyces atratus]
MPPADNSSSWYGLWNGSPRIPHVPLNEETRRSSDLPGTLLPAPAGMNHPVIFEPALKQFTNAYRAGEPEFDGEGEGEEMGRAWRRAWRTALDTVLAAVTDGPWGRHLVLRGSALMATWFGEAAREPGDLDFLVVPQDWAMDGPRASGLFDTIARDAAAAARGSVRIDAAGMVTEDIWTYDRVPGRRMLLPWTAPGAPGGTVQLDVVFNKTLPSPAAVIDLQPLGDGPGCRVLAASPELSLAWKLLWLITDAYPQGKDLYDAVLLAEVTPPRYELVRDAVVLGGTEGLRPAGTWWLDWLDVETGWGHFIAEHPWVTESAASYRERLARALAPLLETAVQPEEDPYSQWARWLKPLVESARTTAAECRAAGLGHLAEGGGAGLAAAAVIVRELAGSRSLGLDDALATVLSHEDSWHYWRENPDACVRALDVLR